MSDRSANPLLSALPPIPSLDSIASGLQACPAFNPGIAVNERPYEIDAIRGLYVPTTTMVAIARGIDVMIRDGYRSRDPADVRTVASLYTNLKHRGLDDSRYVDARGMFVSGLAGVGKTATIRRALARYPQVIEHQSLSGFRGPCRQLVWLHVDLPAACSLGALADALWDATREALGGEAVERKSGSRNAQQHFSRWVQVAKSHFLGLLALDEGQNLFRLKSLQQRNKSARNDLRVGDDAAAMELLRFTNCGIPLLLGGTPEAATLFSLRAAFASRLASEGMLSIDRFQNPESKDFKDGFMPKLLRYQFGDTPLPNTPELRVLLHSRTAGIRRNIISLWRHSVRHAELLGERIALCHIEEAAQRYMSDMVPIVSALLADDNELKGRYQDLG